jgi:RND family efflux transporter MFP subunit
MTQKKRTAIVFVVVLLVVGIVYHRKILDWVTTPEGHVHTPAETSTGAPAAEVWICPMHPEYRSDRPGNCPICNMQLVRKEVLPSGAPATGSGAPAEGTAPPTPIFIAPQRQQLIGVRYVAAERRPLHREIRTVGKVAFDETKVTHIHTKVTGYIEHVYADFVGRPVRKGEPLFTIYSPELVATQREYLIALRSQEHLKDAPYAEIREGARSLVHAARERLRLWDVSEEDIRRLEETGEVRRTVTIYSPVSGIVTDRMAYHHGRYVNPEMDLYTIVDLSTVWVLAEFYEFELPWLRTGQHVEIEFPYAERMRKLHGKITFLYPYLDPQTRTVQARMEFPNPDLTLRPDMFIHAVLHVSLGTHVVVPEDAVLDTGTLQYVFVDRGNGYIEPRRVLVRARAEGFAAIESGLQPGERVATAANFLLDSESRLKGALAQLGAPEVPGAAHPGHAQHGGGRD